MQVLFAITNWLGSAPPTVMAGAIAVATLPVFATV